LIDRTFLLCPGIGPKLESRLKQQGFASWADCLQRPDDLPLGPIVKERLLSFLRESVQALSGDDIAFFVERLPPREHWRILVRYFDQATFFDIETSALSPYHGHVSVITAYRQGRLYWFLRDRNLDDPPFFPESGEPEDYILEGTHDPELAEKIGNIWEMVIPEHGKIKRKKIKNPQGWSDEQIYFIGKTWPGVDFFGGEGVGYAYVTLRARRWLEENAGEWLSFTDVLLA